MTTRQKVERVAELTADYPLDVALAALELPRSTWYYHQAQDRRDEVRYGHLRAPLEAIAAAHPSYGYRRVVTELREIYDLIVNGKVVRRLHQLWDLPIVRTVRVPRPSGIYTAIQAAGHRANLLLGLDLATVAPFGVFYSDFTELLYDDGRRKAHLVPLLDHASRLVVGWALGGGPDTATALVAWRQARDDCRARGVDLAGAIVHHDRGSAFISYDWAASVRLRGGVRLSYALGGAKDNPFMEAFNSTFKCENHGLFIDADSFHDLHAVVAERMAYYNHVRRHSSLGNIAPSEHLARLGYTGWRP